MDQYCDKQTAEYLREVILINSKRMKVEGVNNWWTDEVLLVVFAGLIKRKLLKLPNNKILQALEIARICLKICLEEKTHYDVFLVSVGGMNVNEYICAMQRAEKRLLF